MPPKTPPFDPDAFISNWSREPIVPNADRTFRDCIIQAFNLPLDDNYVYRAQGETTLEITEKAIGGKRAHGLHGWYHDEEGKPLDPPHPSPPETTSYTTLFYPSVSLPKSLSSFRASAKAQTLRSIISTYLESRYLNTYPPLGLIPAKKDRTHTNPYLDIWTYTCHELEWAGPVPSTTYTKISHHILPHLYHHFGCVVPSYAALYALVKIAQPAKPKENPNNLPILDIGSGTGYWTYMLRTFPLPAGAGWKPVEVRAIDNKLSTYRTSWINDTITTSGMDYLKQQDGGKGTILLLVYPQATGNFTGPLLKAFRGDWIVVAGTQNGNGFTGFVDTQVEVWVEKNLKEWELVLRIPLPSFAGKDEGMFVWRRKEKVGDQ